MVTLPSVSMVFLYRDREKQFEQTLLSIERQHYAGPLELIVVEDGDDGGVVARMCQRFGARHIQKIRGAAETSGRHQYWTKNPPFGNLPILRNTGIQAAQNDVIIFQDAEVRHDNNVIEELAMSVIDSPNLLVNCKMKMMAEDGVKWHWRSHPTEPPCPMWMHIGTPNAIRRDFILRMGGFEELFAGYGYDDDYFFYQIRKQGITKFSDQAEATHLWHPGIPYDYPTGRANRAICARLNHETNAGLRPPTANYRSRDVLDSEFYIVNREILTPIIRSLLGKYSISEFTEWAQGWLSGKTDEHGDLAREIAEKMGVLKICPVIMAAESAWALRCAENAQQVGAIDSAEHLLAWARTAATVALRGE
jgi:glycosyltransferase involved in cell wall biosynthesis